MSYLGRKLALGLKKEAIRGTEESTPAIFMPIIGTPVAKEMVGKTINENSGGTIAEGVGEEVVKRSSEVSLEGFLGDQSIGHYLMATLGAVATTSQPNGVYQHDFNVADNSVHPSYTIYKHTPQQGYSFAGCMLSSAELTAQLGQAVLFKATFMGKGGNEKAGLTPATTEEINFRPSDVTVKYADTVAGLAGAGDICVQSFKLTIDKGLLEKQCLGEVDIKTPYNGVFAVSGEIEMTYDSNQYRDDFVNGAQKAIKLSMTNASKTIGTASDNASLDLTIHSVYIQDAEDTNENSGLATQTVQFKGYLNQSDGEIITAQLTNDTASY